MKPEPILPGFRWSRPFRDRVVSKQADTTVTCIASADSGSGSPDAPSRQSFQCLSEICPAAAAFGVPCNTSDIPPQAHRSSASPGAWDPNPLSYQPMWSRVSASLGSNGLRSTTGSVNPHQATRCSRSRPWLPSAAPPPAHRLWPG